LIRAKAIVFLMLHAGPRIEEVERLTLDDVELRPKSGVLHIWQGKGFRECDVPLRKPSLDITLPQSQFIMSLEKSFEEINRADLLSLVEDKVTQNRVIEYKRELPSESYERL
jgi:site-specific recombinase XerC